MLKQGKKENHEHNYQNNTLVNPSYAAGHVLTKTELMSLATSYISSGDVSRLQSLFYQNINNINQTFNEELWHQALHTGKDPNYDIFSVLLLYGVPVGSYQKAVLHRFNPGFFGTAPKETLIRYCENARTNPQIKNLVRNGLLEGSDLLRVLRYENGGFVTSYYWEQQVRNIVNPPQTQYHNYDEVVGSRMKYQSKN